MTSLKQALEDGRLEQFIAEREGTAGDALEMERIIRSMAGASKEAPEASSQGDCND
jgi:hypothetical protein